MWDIVVFDKIKIPISYEVVASAEVIIHKIKLGFKCD